MDSIADIRAMPRDTKAMGDYARPYHESSFRAYHIVQKVQDLLRRGTPPDVVLELIREMEGGEPEG